ncbi:MucR family transcriptional regulator [Roseococcus sp.]|uniref:MucR family transcriptional regulator n=1 Tax=Roseococcus sp. TaxID=2109646 RepID=UPI003BAA5B42
MSDSKTAEDLLGITAGIVAAHVSRNTVSTNDLARLIAEVHRTLATLATPTPPPVAVEPLVPAVSVRKSITPEYLICLEDGKKLKMLKRHLHAAYGMTPDVYRAKWGLPAEYPMVAPNYASRRSELAKGFGLGRKKAAD